MSGGNNIALHAPVESLDSTEAYGWGRIGLTDGVLAPDGHNSAAIQSLLLRREFTVKPGLRRAVVQVTGLGNYEMAVNGGKVGGDLLTAG